MNKLLEEILKEHIEIQNKATRAPWFVEDSEVRADMDPETTESGVSDCTVSVCDIYRISEELDDGGPDRYFIAKSRTEWPKTTRALQCAIEYLNGNWKDSGVAQASGIARDADEVLEQIHKIMNEEEEN